MSSALDGWTDTHCHLHERFDSFAATTPSRKDQLVHAAQADVRRLICVGTNAASSREALAFADEVATSASELLLWSSVGLHPHEASAGTAEITAILEEKMASQGASRGPGCVVAVGECGLDYFYEYSDRAAQRQAFADQIELAHRYDLALIVHTRDAFEETFELLGDVPARQRVIIHCFSGGPAEAERFIALGCFVSFSGIVTFKNAEATREALRRCPSDLLLVETDAPFLAPVPHRGRANEPAFVAIVGTAAAEIRGESPEALAATTSANAVRAFALQT